MNWYRKFLVQNPPPTPSIHSNLTERGKYCCMQNNQLSTQTWVEFTSITLAILRILSNLCFGRDIINSQKWGKTPCQNMRLSFEWLLGIGLRHIRFRILATKNNRRQLWTCTNVKNIKTMRAPWKNDTYVRQHAWMMFAIDGSVFSGIGSLRCWKPTAPTTWTHSKTESEQ